MGRKKSLLSMLGISFSWKRAIGITAMRRKIARATGIPTTREGRRRKFGPSGAFILDRMLMSGHPKDTDDQRPPSDMPIIVDQQADDLPAEYSGDETSFGCAVCILIYVIGFLSGCIVSAVIARFLN